MVDKIYEIKDCAVIDIENGHIADLDQLQSYIDESIDSACIYYSDCYEILRQSSITDFSEYIEHYGARTITDFAYYVLREEADNYGLFEELEEVLEKNTCEEDETEDEE